MNEPTDGDGRCGRCPLAPGVRCAGADAPRLCQLVDPGHPDHDPSYLAALSAGDAGPQDPRPPRPVAASLRLLREMRACPHRLERADCGCDGLASCGLGVGRGGLVGLAECFDCLDPLASTDARPLHGSRTP